jgi:cytochrome oxidase assembly protein ShyY1
MSHRKPDPDARALGIIYAAQVLIFVLGAWQLAH